jgi:hypothetical protein
MRDALGVAMEVERCKTWRLWDLNLGVSMEVDRCIIFGRMRDLDVSMEVERCKTWHLWDSNPRQLRNAPEAFALDLSAKMPTTALCENFIL